MSAELDWGSVDLNLARLLEAELFDAAFYRTRARLAPEDDAFAHYFREGRALGLRANVVFDPDWYVRENPEADRAGADPLLHYALVGEPAGRDPSPWFDVAWYRRTHGVERPLAHYLARRFGPFSPIPEFDAAYYLTANPDVGQARLDPFVHYMHFGYRDFRKPRADFNPRLYANRWLDADRGANPVAHLRARKEASPPPRAAGPFTQMHANVRRGPRFEDPAPLAAAKPEALILAYHLTQFHRVAENDAWWGEGFTEWTQLARGAPRFEGHYQPRIPGRLGFYDLTDPDALRAQAALARGAGVNGFVFYYYDFDGRRLLEKPLEQFLSLPDIDIAFCLMWANENWTRRWDGADEEVLIAQSYDPAQEERRCAEFARHFRDPRYVRLQGRPLLMVYRASLIPDAARTLARWRRLFALKFSENPIFVMAQCFDDVDPRPLGFEGAVEFPPHKLTKGLPQVYDSLDIYDEAFEADVFAYDDLVAASLGEAAPEFALIKTAVPSWDNDARRQGKGLTLVGSSPRKYERWLGELISRAKARPLFGSAVVCVNAWNEWSEGAYLEPDVHFGAAYLNATARAAFAAVPGKTTLALDDPADAGLGEIARRLASAFGFCVARGADAAKIVVRQKDAQPEADSDSFLRALFQRLAPETAKISVFIRNDNAGERLPALLRAVFAQTHPLWEVVVLDLASTDDSLDAAEAVARGCERDLGFADAEPSAAEIALWRQAVELASGDFVWLIEADGLCDPEATALLAEPIQADPSLAMAFCDSARVDASGQPIDARPGPLASTRRFVSDQTLAGPAFVDKVLVESPGAVLWRRDALARALATFGEPGAFNLNQLCRAVAAQPGARVRYVAERLNFIRSRGPETPAG